MKTHLTAEQKERFEREGYLVLPGVFGDAEVEKMQREANRILETCVNSSLALERSSGRLDWLQGENGAPMVRKVQPINDLSAYFQEISGDPRLLDPMRDIMGDEPVLMEEKLNYKQPLHAPLPLAEAGLELPTRSRDDRFPPHNDWAYYKAQNYPRDIISSALSLDECTSDNGPLHIWPGSHREHLEHEAIVDFLQVKPGLIDFEGGQDVLAPPGSVMFFHALLIHDSRPNTTDQPRRLMIYSHYPRRFNLGHDVRNGPTREREQPFERRYRDLVESGEYADQFHLSAA